MSNARLPSTSETIRPSSPTATETMDTIPTENEICGTTETISPMATTIHRDLYLGYLPTSPSPPHRSRSENEARGDQS